MREYQKTPNSTRFFLIAMAFICLVSQTSYSKITEPLPLDDPNAVAQIILSAMKKIQLPKSGRGSAVMRTENYDSGLDGKELIVNFSFKDQNSRTDIFESNDGIKGQRLKSTILSERHRISLSEDEVFIDRARPHSDYGRDFHPDVFMAFKNRHLTKHLLSYIENFERPGINHSIELDSNGILHIIDQGHVVMPERNEEYDHKYHFSFDTQKALLPVFYCSAMRHEPNDWGRTEAKLEWKKYESHWYVSRVEYGMKPKDTDHRIAMIKDFKPNIEISDEEFTLDGMNIPDGFLVVDFVSGLQYRYVKPENKSKSS